MPAASEAKIRLQIAVDDDLANRIDSLAQRMNRSTSFLVAELLIAAVEERQRFLDWIAWRVVKLVGGADPRKLVKVFRKSKVRTPNANSVYLQTFVSPGFVEQLERMAKANQRTRADMSSLLLNWVVEDEEWLIKAVTNRSVAEWYDAFRLPRGRRSKGNQEENRKRSDADETRNLPGKAKQGIAQDAA